MKLIQKASGKSLVITRAEWTAIGKQAGWEPGVGESGRKESDYPEFWAKHIGERATANGVAGVISDVNTRSLQVTLKGDNGNTYYLYGPDLTLETQAVESGLPTATAQVLPLVCDNCMGNMSSPGIPCPKCKQEVCPRCFQMSQRCCKSCAGQRTAQSTPKNPSIYRKLSKGNKSDWFDMKNQTFKKGDIIAAEEDIFYDADRDHKGWTPDIIRDFERVEGHPIEKGMVQRCAIGDHLKVVGADCIGAFVLNVTHPEMNPRDRKGQSCWLVSDINATLIPATK